MHTLKVSVRPIDKRKTSRMNPKRFLLVWVKFVFTEFVTFAPEGVVSSPTLRENKTNAHKFSIRLRFLSRTRGTPAKWQCVRGPFGIFFFKYVKKVSESF